MLLQCSIFLLLKLSLSLPSLAQQTPIQLNLGVIIEGNHPIQEAAFKTAIDAANKRLASLKSTASEEIKLGLVIRRIENGNAFEAAKTTCDLLKEQVVAIFGPISNGASFQALSICHKFNIPYLQAHWSTYQPIRNYSINLHPQYKHIGLAINSFLREAEDWNQLGLIYSEEDGLMKFESLLSNFGGEVVMRKWVNTDLNHKYVIKYFRNTLSQFRFLVDIPRSEIESFLELISEYNMTSQYYSYIFTDWDTQFVNPSAFSGDRGANFSTLSLLPDLGLDYQSSQSFERLIGKSLFAQSTAFEDSNTNYPTESLTFIFLIFDTIHLLSEGLSRLAATVQIEPPFGLSCDKEETWSMGTDLITMMKSSSETRPLHVSTGPVEFDDDGLRTNVNLTFLEMSPEGFQKYGYWNSRENLVVTKKFATTQAEIQKELKGQTLRVTTIEDKPFVMYKGNISENGERSSDSRHWHGFCIDLLNECAAALHFNYTVHLVADGTYGSATLVNGVEIWDGIIGELQHKKADLAVASLTINYERERVIDFTTPFMNLGVSIIFKKPVPKEPDLFSFLRPLSPPVWGYVLIAYVGVSMALFFVARFSPYEWANPHPCNADSELLENNFNMLNSLWFTIGSLMQQGSDIVPRATSTRIIAGSWWFFTLIIISSYTANLAAFLTVERMKAPIEDVNDLAKQTTIKYGTREGGSSAAFFEKSNVSVYQRMWQFMTSHKNVMMNNTEEAIARVRRGGYAYILESTMNEYYTQRDCELMQVGHNLDSKGYGVGFPQGSKYRDSFSEVILQLQMSQTLEQMRRYWWRNYSIVQPCNEQQAKKQDANSLGPEQIGGCFVMVVFGLGTAILISLVEFLYKAYQRSKTAKRSMREEVAREFRFSMARSNTRDFGAESALALPPPPANCLFSLKDCRAAAMAYAPCLPAAERPVDKTGPQKSRCSERKYSVFDVVRMHRRCSSITRSRSPNSTADNTNTNNIQRESAQRLLSARSSSNIIDQTATQSGAPSLQQIPINRTVMSIKPAQQQKYQHQVPVLNAPYVPSSGREAEGLAGDRNPVVEIPRSIIPEPLTGSNLRESACDVRVKKFTC